MMDKSAKPAGPARFGVWGELNATWQGRRCFGESGGQRWKKAGRSTDRLAYPRECEANELTRGVRTRLMHAGELRIKN